MGYLLLILTAVIGHCGKVPAKSRITSIISANVFLIVRNLTTFILRGDIAGEESVIPAQCDGARKRMSTYNTNLQA